MSSNELAKVKALETAVTGDFVLNENVTLYELASLIFGEEGLKDFVSRCFESDCDELLRKDIRNSVMNIINSLCNNICFALRKLSAEWKVEVELPESESALARFEWDDDELLPGILANMLQLFYAVYNFREIPSLLSEVETLAMSRVQEAILKLKSSQAFIRISHEWSIATVMNKFEENIEGQKMSSQATTFARDDGVLVASSFVRSREHELSHKSVESFITEAEAVFPRMDNNFYDLHQFRRLNSLKLEGHIKDGGEFMRKLLSYLSKIEEVLDIRVSKEYMKFMRKVFLSYGDVDCLLESFFHCNLDAEGNIKNLKKLYTDYDSDLVRLMNSLGDHNQLQDDRERLSELVKEFAWLFCISPKPTMFAVLKYCIDNKPVVPNVLRIFRNLSLVISLKLPLTSNTHDEREYRSLIILALRHLLESENILKNDVRGDCFVYLVSALSRDRFAVLHGKEAEESAKEKNEDVRKVLQLGEIIDKAVVDGAELLRYFVLPGLFQQKNMVVLLRIAERMLSDLGAKKTTIDWEGEVDKGLRSKYETEVPLMATIVLSLFIDIYRAQNATDPAVGVLCLRCIKTLGKKLNAAGVCLKSQFRQELDRRTVLGEWPLKYAVVSWMGKALDLGKPQIPSSLFDSLPMKKQGDFEKILTDFEFSPSECFMRSIFELGGFSSELAIDFLSKGIAVPPSDVCLGTQIARAFLECANNATSEEKIFELHRTAAALLEKFQPTRSHYMVESLSASYMYGLSRIEPLLLLADTVILALRSSSTNPEKSDCKLSDHVVLSLLNAYCCLVNEHIKREVIELRQHQQMWLSEKKEVLPTAEDFKVDRLACVHIQLAQLFMYTCMITEQIGNENLPRNLHILLVTLIDYEAELMGRANKELLEVADLDVTEALYTTPNCSTESMSTSSHEKDEACISQIPNEEIRRSLQAKLEQKSKVDYKDDKGHRRTQDGFFRRERRRGAKK
ncbi:hypothetical protein AB6A40_001114 [Gnathostoma spinigerum]|uniref:Edg1 TPR repeats region domain-containing protein n=1 Tax=Gnathostoma spinigerum TaxID=75299 RepID=A0ABD6E3H2_9BILA